MRRAEVQGDVSRCALGRELVRHGPAEQVAVEAQCPVEVRSADDGERGADHGLVLSVGVYGVVVYGSDGRAGDESTLPGCRPVDRFLEIDAWRLPFRRTHRCQHDEDLHVDHGDRAHPRRSPRAHPPARHRPDHRSPVDPVADRRGDQRVRGSGSRLRAAAADGPRRRRPARLRFPRRIRSPAAVPRRPEHRGDLDQPARPGVRRAARPLGADDGRDVPGRGARPGGAHAQAVRPAARPVLAVRRRAAAGREPAARGDPRHHAGAPQPEHPQVRRGRERARRSGGTRLHHRTRRPLPRGRGDGGTQHHRRRRHPGRKDDAAEHVAELGPGPGARGHCARRSSSCDPPCRMSWPCRPASRTWRATARSGSAGW